MPVEGAGPILPQPSAPPVAPVRPAPANLPARDQLAVPQDGLAAPVRQDVLTTTSLADRPDVPASLDLVDDDAIARLIEQLYADDITVRDGAVTELLKLGKAAAPALLKVFNSSDSEVSARARETLIRMGGEAAVDLAKFMTDGKQPADARRHAADILKTISNAILAQAREQEQEKSGGGPLVFPGIAIPRVVQDCASALREGLQDPAVREAALEALCSLGTTIIRPAPADHPLTHMLADTLEELLGPAALAAALKAGEDPSAPNEQLLRLLVERSASKDRAGTMATLRKTIQNHGHPAVQAMAAQLLAELGDRSAGDLLLAAVKASPDTLADPDIIAALGRLKVRAAVPDLIDILKTTGDVPLLQAAVQALGEIGDQAAADALLTLSLVPARPSWLRRQAAEAAKALLGAEDAARRLTPELDPQRQPDASRRKAAVVALGALEDQAMMAGILQAMQDPDASVRAEAVRALEHNPGPHFPLFIAALRDPDPDVRQAVLSVMYRCTEPDLMMHMIPAVRGALADPDPETRRMAVGVLRHAVNTVLDGILSPGPPDELDRAEGVWKEAVDALQGALQQEDDPQVREALEAALRDLKS